MKREPGFYWVKYNGRWEIAEWYTYLTKTGCWFRPGSSSTWKDKEFDQINETRISEPE